MSDVAQVGFAIIVVPDDAAEGKEQDGYRYIGAASATDFVVQGHLGELNAIGFATEGHSAEEDDEGCTGTDNQRVGEYAQGLDESLLHGVSDIGRSSHVRCRTHTGFVAEETALDTLHQGHTDTATQGLFPTEGRAYDELDDIRQVGDVHAYDDEGQNDVSQGHDRHDDAAYLGNALDTTEDNHEREHGEDDAHPSIVELEGLLEGCTDGVALHGVEGKGKGEDDEHGKEYAHPRLLETLLHVVSRTTDVRGLSLYLI